MMDIKDDRSLPDSSNRRAYNQPEACRRPNPLRRRLRQRRPTHTLPGGISQIAYSAVVEQPDARAPFLLAPVQTSILDLPGDALHFLLPSRYCPSDRMISWRTTCSPAISPGTPPSWPSANGSTSTSPTNTAPPTPARRPSTRSSSCKASAATSRIWPSACAALSPSRPAMCPATAWACSRRISTPTSKRTSTAVGSRSTPPSCSRAPRWSKWPSGRDAADCAWCTLYGSGTTNELSVEVTLLDTEKDSK